MNAFYLFSFLFAIFIASSQCQKVSYEGYQRLRLFPNTKENFDYLISLETTETDFDIWNARKDQYLDVLLSPIALIKYSKIFRERNITVKVLSENIQTEIDREEQTLKRNRLLSESPRNIIFKYARYTEIKSFVDTVVYNNPDIASSYSAGLTYEQRDLRVIVLKTPSSNRAIWIDCGIHAREWVAPATCVYIIDTLVSKYKSNDTQIVKLLNKYEFHILPLMNPDGYEYSWTNNRLWRKNRTPNPGFTCIGTDLNRNFDYRWFTGGSSDWPCMDTYAGAKANSELETRAVISAIEKKLGSWDSYISIHSYGQWWLTPYGHATSSAQLPPDYSDLVAKGNIGAAAIRALYGTKFVVGASAQLLYINTGNSQDYFYAKAGIKYSYVIELRPGQGDWDEIYDFELPEDRMPFVARETFEGLKAFILAI